MFLKILYYWILLVGHKNPNQTNLSEFIGLQTKTRGNAEAELAPETS